MSPEPGHVVDANAILALIVERPYSAFVRSLGRSSPQLIAPDLIVHEVGNALSYYIRAGNIMLDEAMTQYDTALSVVTLMPGTELAAKALAISASTNHSIYDCFYAALARQKTLPLVTADRKLLKLATRVQFEAVDLNNFIH